MATKGKGMRKNIKCEKTELLHILRSYQVHPGDYDGIDDEVLANKSQLGARVVAFYEETPKQKLKARVRDQVFLLISKKRTNLDDDIRAELDAVLQLQNTPVSEMNKPPKAATTQEHVDVRTTWGKTKKPDDNRRKSSDSDSIQNENINVSISDDSDVAGPSNTASKPPKRPQEQAVRKGKGKKRKAKDIERENARMYNKLLKVLLPKAEKLFASDSSEPE